MREGQIGEKKRKKEQSNLSNTEVIVLLNSQ